MGCFTPDMPSAPDPTQTAMAQSAANKETAITQAQLNRFNQVTPTGTLTWGATPATPKLDANGQPVLKADGTPEMNPVPENSWTATQTLSPDAQYIFNNQMGAGKTLSDSLSTKANQALYALRQPMAELGATPDAQGIYNQVRANTVDPAKQNLASLQPLAQQLNNTTSNLTSAAERAALGYTADAANAPALPVPDAAYRDQVTSALYDQNASRLNPQWQQAESDMEARLAAQGVTHGSAAYDRDYGNLQRAKTDAYQTARNNAISGGTAAQQAQFGMGLQANQQGMANAAARASTPLNLASAAQGMNATQQSNINAGLSGLLAAESAAPATAQGLYGYENQARLQEYTDQQMRQNNLLAQLAAMNSGTAVQQPGFLNQNTGVNVANTDVAGIINNAYQGQMSGYNAQVGQGNSLIGAAGMLGAAGIKAW